MTVLLNITGCATTALVKYSESHENSKSITSFESYKEGVITNDGVVRLCFSDEGHDYTIQLSIKDFIIDSKKYKTITLPTSTITIDEKNIYSGCKLSPEGDDIAFFDVFNINDINKQDLERKVLLKKYKHMITIPDEELYKKQYKPAYVNIYIKLDDNRTKKLVLYTRRIITRESCPACYVALPATVAIDVVTFPLQAIIYIFSFQWLEQG